MRGHKVTVADRLRTSRAAARATTACVTLLLAGALAACSSTPQPTSSGKRTQTKEYFAESEYGVKASPRVTNKRSRLPRGGGRDQIGKPYKVKGQWYRPKEEPGYRRQGAASWYGDAFHGRLTANGEVYDMTHLTAAHPTMPLPSYARVTNLKNNSSVIVRVNDRGPFAKGRVIDLSKRAAEMLDYTHSGVAKVQVEYLGRAPLHGQDDAFLVASYRPGGGRAPVLSDPNDGLPTGVMIAMDGPAPSRRTVARPAFPPAPVARQLPVQMASATPVTAASQRFDLARIEAVLSAPTSTYDVAAGDPVLPAMGPLLPERPTAGFEMRPPVQVASGFMSYADERVARAAGLSAIDRLEVAPEAVVAAWKRSAAPEGEYIAAATLVSEAGARELARRLDRIGSARIVGSDDAYVVELRPSDGRSIDDLLQLAWASGAPDSMIVRAD